MPRKTLKPREKRGLPPADYRHNSVLVSRLINKINFAGKKSNAEDIVYSALDRIQEKTKEDPMQVFNRAIETIRPLLEVRPRRVGGATYQIPVEVRSDRRVSLAMRWMVIHARKRPGHTMQEKLAGELLDAANNTGASVKKREDGYRMAEANKAFAHYRW